VNLDRTGNDMEWIAIENQLPPQNVYVLVSKFDGREGVKMHSVQIANRLGSLWFDDKDGDLIAPKYGIITHWMPLPSPLENI